MGIFLRCWKFKKNKYLKVDIKISRHCTKEFTYICCFRLIHTSMGCSRQEYWSGLSHPPPEDLHDPGIEHTSLTSPALEGGFFTTHATCKPCFNLTRALKW